MLIISICITIKIFYLLKKRKLGLLKIRGLNQNLKDSLIDMKRNNLILKNKNQEIKGLLSLNERTLFSKVLKISTYSDKISVLGDDLAKLIESNTDIKPNNLFRIERALKSMIDEDEMWEDFQIQFEKTRPDFFKKLKQISTNLSVNDLKHYTYIIAKLKIKDVANLVNISPRSVETVRYRIKKKLYLDKDSSLFYFLQNL